VQLWSMLAMILLITFPNSPYYRNSTELDCLNQHSCCQVSVTWNYDSIRTMELFHQGLLPPLLTSILSRLFFPILYWCLNSINGKSWKESSCLNC